MWPHLFETIREATEGYKATCTTQSFVGVIVGADCDTACRYLLPQALKRLRLPPPSPPFPLVFTNNFSKSEDYCDNCSPVVHALGTRANGRIRSINAISKMLSSGLAILDGVVQAAMPMQAMDVGNEHTTKARTRGLKMPAFG